MDTFQSVKKLCVIVIVIGLLAWMIGYFLWGRGSLGLWIVFGGIGLFTSFLTIEGLLIKSSNLPSKKQPARKKKKKTASNKRKSAR